MPLKGLFRDERRGGRCHDRVGMRGRGEFALLYSLPRLMKGIRDKREVREDRRHCRRALRDITRSVRCIGDPLFGECLGGRGDDLILRMGNNVYLMCFAKGICSNREYYNGIP